MITATQVRPWLLASACVLAGVLLGAPAASAQSRAPLSLGEVRADRRGREHRVRHRGPCRSTTIAPPVAKCTSPSRACRPRTMPHRLGSLFFNFGGPGGAAADYLQAVGRARLLEALNERFDIVGFDPRGRRPEHAVDRLQGQPGDAAASTRSRSPRRSTSTWPRCSRKDKAYIRRA